MELDDPPATGALAAQLTVVRAIEDRGQQPEDRNRRGDKEPQKERGPLRLAYKRADQPKQDRDRDVAEVLNGNPLLAQRVQRPDNRNQRRHGHGHVENDHQQPGDEMDDQRGRCDEHNHGQCPAED